MKFSSAIAAISAFFLGALAAPVTDTTNSTSIAGIPSEAITGYLDLSQDSDIGLVPVNSGNSTGLLFVNTTVLAQANDETTTLSRKREAAASADAWHWLEFQVGEPLYIKKREASADADAWHWLEFQVGEPLYI